MPRNLALLAILLVLAAPATALRPIDDFEIGPFSFQTTGAYQEHLVPVASYEGHLYASPRKIVLEPAASSTTIAVQLAPTGGDDAAEVSFEGDGRVRFVYEWDLPRDVTENGRYDRIEVAYDFVTPGAYFSFAIGNVGTFCGVERFPGPGPGVVSWPIDICDGLVDPTQAIAFVLYCSANGADAIFEITDVRLMRAGAVVPNIERDFVAIQVPPIPSPPLTWRTLDPSLVPLFQTDLGFENVDNGGYVPELSADLQEESFHGGDAVRSTVVWQDPVEPGNVDFLLAVDLTTAGDLTPEIVYPPDPIHGPDDFTVLMGAMLVDDATISHGTSMMRLTVAANPAQDHDLADVQVLQIAQNRLEISFRLEAAGPFDPSQPLLDILWLADWEADQLTGVASPIPIDRGALTLVAAPSLTPSSTTLRASRPFASGETIAIYDVAGRLIRRLAPAAGAAAVVWDGRDRAGSPAASGTYFARWQGPSGTGAVARVVRVR